MKPLAVALIGAGRMGAAHAHVLQTVLDVTITHVCDPTLDSARHLSDAIKAKPLTDLAAVLDDPSVEAVIITTPTPTHADLVERCAAVGKAIFVEKPIADTIEAGQRVVEIVLRTGVQCQVGFQRRYDPAYVETKHRIDNGELGRLEGFRGVSRDPAPPPLKFLLSSGGIMVDMGIHDLDSARYLLGEVRQVYCTGSVLVEPVLAKHGLFDTAVATLQFMNGALGTIEVGLRTAYGYEIRAEVLGELGKIHIEKEQRHHLVQYGADGVRHDYPQHFPDRFPEAYAAEIRAFAENVRQGRPVSPNAEDALESLRLALAAQRSLETGHIIEVQSFGKE